MFGAADAGRGPRPGGVVTGAAQAVAVVAVVLWAVFVGFAVFVGWRWRHPPWTAELRHLAYRSGDGPFHYREDRVVLDLYDGQGRLVADSVRVCEGVVITRGVRWKARGKARRQRRLYQQSVREAAARDRDARVTITIR